MLSAVASMIITVEPGCYFNPVLLLPAFEVRVAIFKNTR